MSLFGELRKWLRPTVRLDFDLNDAFAIIQGQSAGELYRTQPHLRTVVSFLADNVAQLNIKEFRRVSDTDRQRVTDDVMIRLLQRPNPDQTGFELIRQLVSDLALYDQAFWLVVEDAEQGWSIRPIPPAWVTAKQGGSVFAPDTWRIDSGRGVGWIDVPASSMLVFHGWNPGEPTGGVSPVHALKDVINEQIQAWSYRTQVWQRGGRIGAVLTRPANAPEWDDDARARFRRGWKEFSDRGARAGSTPILEDGMKLERIGFNAREEEFSEVTKLSLQTVASVYHVSPVMVGVLDNANFANTREFRKMLYSQTLGPTIRMIEDRINTFLAPMIGMDSRNYIEFDIRGKLNGDFEEQASVLSTSVGAPWVTPNEARAMNNLPALDGGDGLVVPLNVTQGGQASPQDGGDPIRQPLQEQDGGDEETAKAAISAWHDRAERTIRSQLGAGKTVDDINWKRWTDELTADLTVRAGFDQCKAADRSMQEMRLLRTELGQEAER